MSGPRITDAAVEAGARALHAADGTSSFDEWDVMANHERGLDEAIKALNEGDFDKARDVARRFGVYLRKEAPGDH